MSENSDDDRNEDEKRIKVVKLRKKVVKVVAHTDRNLNKFKNDFIESSHYTQDSRGYPSGRNYSQGRDNRGVRPGGLDRDNVGRQQQDSRGYPSGRNYSQGRDNRGVRPGGLDRDNVGRQQQDSRGYPSGRNYSQGRDNRGVRPGGLDRDNVGRQQQDSRGYPSGRNYSQGSNGFQTFRRVIRAKVTPSVTPAPVDSDSKGLNRKLGEKKKQQQESQKSYKRKKRKLKLRQ